MNLMGHNEAEEVFFLLLKWTFYWLLLLPFFLCSFLREEKHLFGFIVVHGDPKQEEKRFEHRQSSDLCSSCCFMLFCGGKDGEGDWIGKWLGWQLERLREWEFG
jgi:hypothetical protein